MKTSKKVIFFPKYNEKGPSSRYRLYQYLPMYQNDGFDISVYPLFGDNYFTNKNVFFRVFVVLYYYLRRLVQICSIKRSNIIWIEKELFPFMPSFVETILYKLGVFFVVEYDDAIFHRYDANSNCVIRFLFKNKISKVISRASIVVTGSPYLTSYALGFNSNVIEIPTSLSLAKYQEVRKTQVNDVFTIGWIGSNTTSVNVLKLRNVLIELSSLMDYQLHLIGFNRNLKSCLSNLNVSFIEWNEDTELDEIRKFDVGIMPLDDNPFNRGKCGFKLIQYMACSKPTISTPLEANVKINRNMQNLHAVSDADWINAILSIRNNKNKFEKIGIENYEIFKYYYSAESNYEVYCKILKKCMS